MIDFESKYEGAEVEALLDAVNDKQDAIEDLDEIRSGAAAGATALQSVPNTYATNEYVDNKLATTLNFYRTRFTFLELVEAKHNGELIQEGGKAELAQAITLGKTIVMDYDSVSGVEGHILCNATLEGSEILLQVVFGNEYIAISTFTDGDTIYPDDITYDFFVAESDFNDTIEGLNANKQDTLVSGTNIKTINNQSLLGSGNITISGGGAVPTKLSQLENDTNFVALQGEELPYVETAGLYDPISSVLYSLPGGEWTGAEDKKLAGVVNVGGFNLVECQGITGSSGDMIVLPREADGYEDDILVTRSYLKTINGESILGSGNIEISGGSSGGGKEYVEAPLMTEPMGTSIVFTPSVPLEPNKVYVANKKVSSIDMSRILIPSDSIGAEYTIMFQTSTSELPISVSNMVQLLWADGATPTIEADTYYELSLVVNRLGNTYDTIIFKVVLIPFKAVEQ